MNIMKAVLTLVLVLFFGAVTLAQNTNDKVNLIKMDVVLVTGTNTDIVFEKVTVISDKSVARLYRYQNSRVKKALAFSTKRNSPKMA